MHTAAPLHLILVVAFIVCEGLAGLLWITPAEPYRNSVGWLGLFFFALSLLF